MDPASLFLHHNVFWVSRVAEQVVWAQAPTVNAQVSLGKTANPKWSRESRAIGVWMSVNVN